MSLHVPPIQPFAEFEAETLPMMQRPRVTAFGRVSWGDLDTPGREIEYLIDDWMTEGDVSILGGASGSGKSFIAIDMGMALARGVPWLGKETRRSLVVYQAGEGGKGVKNRLRAYRKHHRLTGEAKVPFELLTARIDIYAANDRGGDTDKLIEAINGIKLEYPDLDRLVIFIDTFATAQGAADEISGKDMAIVLNNVERIKRETGAHVCLVHHMNADGKKLRGHTSLRANVDQVFLVSNNEQTRVKTMVLDKIKDGEDGIKVQFELMQIELGEYPNGKPKTSCVCLPVGEKEAIRKEEEAKGIRLRESEIPYFRALWAALEAHGEPVPPDMALPSSVRAIVHNKQVNTVFSAQHPIDDDLAALSDDEVKAAKTRHWEKLKKRIVAAREGLQRAGVLGITGEKLWWTGKPVRQFRETQPKEQNSPEFPGQSPGGFPEFSPEISGLQF